MVNNTQLNLENVKKLALVGKALSSETRIEILHLLCNEKYNVNEIAEKLDIPPSSAAAHVKVLEEAGIIKSELLPAVRGSMKVSEKAIDRIEIDLSAGTPWADNVEIIDMPIGNFVDYKVNPTCGLAGEKGPIGEEDEPRAFYHPERTGAKLLWLQNGYVEYRFPNSMLIDCKAKEAEVSFECCSEDHDYNLSCKSDITVWINNIEAGTWNCPSDFGGRRGKLNPEWWPDKNTQFGHLKKWKLSQDGTYLDDEKVSEVGIDAYGLDKGNYISVKIGIKENAVNNGGINIFGDCFGDYEQNIRLAVTII